MVRSFPINYSSTEPAWQGNGNHIFNFTGVSLPTDDDKLLREGTMCRKVHSSHPLGVFYGEDPLNFSFSLLMLEIVIVILVTRICRFILRPLKQPRFVAEMIGGMFIGPSALGVNDAVFNRLFPDNSQFVLTNIGIIGFMFFLFVSGVKMDLRPIMKVGKKHIFLGALAFFLPTAAAGAVAFIFRASLDADLSRFASILGVCIDLSVTAFPVVYLILKELNLLSSELGRMALSTSLVSTVLWISLIGPFGAMRAVEIVGLGGMWSYAASLVVLAFFLMVVVPRILGFIVDKTPQGKPINQGCVVFIFMGVFFMGFWSDMLGIAVINGSFWLGLAIPDGPPLGATVVERCETFIMEILMPFSYTVIGFRADVFAMAPYGWSKLAPLFAMTMSEYASKLVVTLLVSLYFKIPLKDSIILSLIMNLKGQLEIMIFAHYLEDKVFKIPAYSMMVILVPLMTGIFTGLISYLYDPTRPYMANKRRTIQHTPADAELRIVLCIHDEECVAGLLNLLDISYPTQASPFAVYAVHLIELVGRATPLFIDNDEPKEHSKHVINEKIYRALQLFQETREVSVKLRSFTIMSPQRSMYQDVCELAMVQKATIIVLPFSKERLDNLAGTEIVRHTHGMQSINSTVIENSPCSVGIFVEKSHAPNPVVRTYNFGHSFRKYVVIFLGGADSREALTYADRMIMNPDVLLMVVRFLSLNCVGDDEKEKKLDDGVVTWFWVKNEANERVVYREVVVENGQDTLEAIQALNDNSIDLWIVGRNQGVNPVLLQGLCRWDENPELGVIGDYVSSDDFESAGSVVVIHQQILRG